MHNSVEYALASISKEVVVEEVHFEEPFQCFQTPVAQLTSPCIVHGKFSRRIVELKLPSYILVLTEEHIHFTVVACFAMSEFILYVAVFTQAMICSGRMSQMKMRTPTSGLFSGGGGGGLGTKEQEKVFAFGTHMGLHSTTAV